MLTFNSLMNFINKKRTGTLQQLFYFKFIQSETLKNVTKGDETLGMSSHDYYIQWKGREV